MLNVTFLSLSVSSLFSLSPLYTVNCNNQRKLLFVSNSFFSRSISYIIYSNTEYHSTTIHKNMFKMTLNTPLVFINEQQGYCHSGEQCCVNNNYNFTPNEIISNINITKDDFGDLEDKNSFFIAVCGNITITQCQFLSCYSVTNCGGGIRIEQYCEVILHNCIFDNCYAKWHGGAGIITNHIYFNYNTDGSFKDVYHEPTKKLDIQYTCFQSCYLTDKPGFGSAVIMGAKEVIFYYASTVDCPKSSVENSTAWGAQFDIYAASISSEFINSTGGHSEYCGSMEYRNAKSGFFRFQTITKTTCKYVTSFTSVNITGLKITSCNIYQNVVQKAKKDWEGAGRPALVFVRINDLIIENFYFKENNLIDSGLFAEREHDNNINIKLIGCYADTNEALKWKADYIITTDCHFDEIYSNTYKLKQLNLGSCQGEELPGPMIISSFFTASSPFTSSSLFSSIMFSKSDLFSKSSSFTDSKKFSGSDKFSKSNYFTGSGKFDKTNYFTGSGKFSNSNKFTKTGEFSRTDNFSSSGNFSSSSIFTFSDEFEKSSYFSPSPKFTASNTFSPSDSFSQSYDFSISLQFTQSDELYIDRGVNIGSSNKGGNITAIAAGVGGAAAAVIIAALIIFFIVKKRRRLPTSDIDLMNETNSSLTVDNALQTIMENDDPFADDF